MELEDPETLKKTSNVDLKVCSCRASHFQACYIKQLDCTVKPRKCLTGPQHKLMLIQMINTTCLFSLKNEKKNSIDRIKIDKYNTASSMTEVILKYLMKRSYFASMILLSPHGFRV